MFPAETAPAQSFTVAFGLASRGQRSRWKPVDPRGEKKTTTKNALAPFWEIANIEKFHEISTKACRSLTKLSTLSCIEHCWQISYSKGSPHSRLAHLKLFLHSFPQNSGLAEGCATKLVGWEDHRISWREVNRKQLQNLGGNDGKKN